MIIKRIKNISAKKIFYVIVFISLIIVIRLALDAGISGDEYRYNNPYGEKVYEFYKTLGKDKSCLREGGRTYGIMFNSFAVSINKVFSIQHIYESRHVTCMILGWLTFLFIALTIKELFGWRFAIFAFIIAFFTPKLFGHSMNNLKDAPLAFTFAFSYYFFIKLAKDIPKFNTKDCIFAALGIAMALASRISGALLIPYLFLLIGFAYFSSINNSFRNLLAAENKKNLLRVVLSLLAISISGYLVSLLFWPYALSKPLVSHTESLKVMRNFNTVIFQIYNGEWIVSVNRPWHYLLKLIIITTPVVLLLGVSLSFLSFKYIINKPIKIYYWIFFVFATIFPVVYIIHKGSNVYGGIRHVLFILPSLIILSTMGYWEIWQIVKIKKKLKYLSLFVVAILLFFPIRHYFVNHPYQYIYFNKAYGGTKQAYGNHELDYYMHSVREGTEWLLENKIK